MITGLLSARPKRWSSACTSGQFVETFFAAFFEKSVTTVSPRIRLARLSRLAGSSCCAELLVFNAAHSATTDAIRRVTGNQVRLVIDWAPRSPRGWLRANGTDV